MNTPLMYATKQNENGVLSDPDIDVYKLKTEIYVKLPLYSRFQFVQKQSTESLL